MVVEIPIPELSWELYVTVGGLLYLVLCYGWFGKKASRRIFKNWLVDKYGPSRINLKVDALCYDHVFNQQSLYLSSPIWLPFYLLFKYGLSFIYKGLGNAIYNASIPPENR
jgi:hypothetical protein